MPSWYTHGQLHLYIIQMSECELQYTLTEYVSTDGIRTILSLYTFLILTITDTKISPLGSKHMDTKKSRS